jgi:hypothetical protein
MLVPQQLLYFRVENITPPEATAIRDHAIEVISREESLSDIEAAATRAAEHVMLPPGERRNLEQGLSPLRVEGGAKTFSTESAKRRHSRHRIWP